MRTYAPSSRGTLVEHGLGKLHINPNGTRGGFVALHANVSEEATVEPEALILQEATLHGPVVVEDGAIVSGSVILIGFIIVKAGAVITGDGILTASNSDHVLVIEGRVAARV